jgi:hypothetical protein
VWWSHRSARIHNEGAYRIASIAIDEELSAQGIIIRKFVTTQEIYNMANRQVIIDQENNFWGTMKTRDVTKALSMMAETCIVTGTQGVAALQKDSFAKMMTEGKWKLIDYSLSDIHVLFPNPATAVIGYKVTEEIIIEGKQLKFTAADSSVWVQEKDVWLCVLHTESIAGDPFRRDKLDEPG